MISVLGTITSLDFSAFDETATLARFRQVAVSFVVGVTHQPCAFYGYHEALAHQLQPVAVAGYYIPGKSAWPSAVPHTSYGDSIPTSAGINIILSHDKDFDASNHRVVCKPGSREEKAIGCFSVWTNLEDQSQYLKIIEEVEKALPEYKGLAGKVKKATVYYTALTVNLVFRVGSNIKRSWEVSKAES